MSDENVSLECQVYRMVKSEQWSGNLKGSVLNLSAGERQRMRKRNGGEEGRRQVGIRLRGKSGLRGCESAKYKSKTAQTRSAQTAVQSYS